MLKDLKFVMTKRVMLKVSFPLCLLCSSLWEVHINNLDLARLHASFLLGLAKATFGSNMSDESYFS